MTRIGFVSAWLMLLLAVVGGLFWYNDWMYRLPTPVPVHYRPVALGSRIYLGDRMPVPSGKPLFLHFYNPECPCSRFNRPHFRSLADRYGSDARFAVVVLSDKKFTAEQIRQKLGVNVPVLFDSTIAARCGVYSTPQAAIVDTDGKLYYRGNYNASRYCTDEKTAYAKIALTTLLNSRQLPVFTTEAMRSYGCSFPVCKN